MFRSSKRTIMVFINVVVMAKRQIMRFTLKSKSEQHVPICHDVPKKMKAEARRKLERTKDICHEPNLLCSEAKMHSTTASDHDAIPHLYRMKALELCKTLESQLTKDKNHVRVAGEEFDTFLRNHVHSFPIQIPEQKLEEFYKLYKHARHEPKPFDQDSYIKMVTVTTDISNIVQDARIRTVQSPAIRPIGDISEMADEQLPSVSRQQTAPFAFPIRQTVIGLAGRVFNKNKSKQEYQSVPSTESLENLNETA
ncbi:protein C1orf43 homolog [Watersipora subatra]|uniref:protein C1orf43 homolog n=1 Tax=Watersipora subatra TaxID=2589382 RepID=UPI00355C57C7